ncbi:hypothetical protein BGX29_011246 [Mortierella sp. GBA35]|nr:hypothetical protein BGX29_011246 [Mortierella sp. GBA35]
MNPHIQQFYASDGTETHIKATYNPIAEQHVVSWSDIVLAFPDGYLVKNGDRIHPFVTDTDDGLLIEPLCVAYQDNVVLKVVLADSVQHPIHDLDSLYWPTRQFRRAARSVDTHRLSVAVSVAEVLAATQPSVKILSQTFLFHDGSQPRLFIALPHQGYEIDNPTEFFTKYGAYTLALLRMVKHGASAAGMVVPPLLGLGGYGGEDDGFAEQVDFVISYLQHFDSARTPTYTATTESSIEPHHRTLTATWLQEEKFVDMRSFLEINDTDTPGGLYRVTTAKERYVRWVCSDHFNEHFGNAARQRLCKAVEDRDGVYEEQWGTARVRLQSPAHARPFYTFLSTSPFLQELHITLDWTTTPEDLKELTGAVQQSNLQKVELSVNCTSSFTSLDRPLNSTKTIHQRLAMGIFNTVQLKNEEGLPVHIRQWPNVFGTHILSLGKRRLNRRAFPMLFELFHSAPHLSHISLLINNDDLDPLFDLLEPFIEEYKSIRQLSVALGKGGSSFQMSFENGCSIPSSVDATVPRLGMICSRFPLDAITKLELTCHHSASEVVVLVQVLLACCTSLQKLTLTVHHNRTGPHLISLSLFELGSIPTLSSLRIIDSLHHEAKFVFPMDEMHLTELVFHLEELHALGRILGQLPQLKGLWLTVSDLDAAYGAIEPIIRRFNRDMALNLENKDGSHAVVRFQHVDSVMNIMFSELDKVKAMTLLARDYISQANQIQDIIERCTSLETLEICCGNTLSLSAFLVSQISTLRTFRLSWNGGRHKVEYGLPLRKLHLDRRLVSYNGNPSTVEMFFRLNPDLDELSLLVEYIGTDLPVYLSAVKSSQAQGIMGLAEMTLKDNAGSKASFSFNKDNNTITSYSLHLAKLDNQDLHPLNLSEMTEFILSGYDSATVQVDKLFRVLITSCPRLESLDVNCGTNYLPPFLQLCDLPQPLKKCILRNAEGQLTPNLDISTGCLNLGNELLPKALYPGLEKILQVYPDVTGLKLLVASIFEAYTFVTSLAVKFPRLAEVKISQQTAGPKMVVYFKDDGGSGRVSSVALDVRKLGQIPASLHPLLTKLTVSGEVRDWTPEDLAAIPLSFCENLTTLELKCPPRQFPRIFRSMHEASLMHPSLRHLKLWDGSRENILTAAQIDDVDAIANRLEQVRMVDFKESPAQLEAILQSYPLEIGSLELDHRFDQHQAEIVEESMKLGKVRVCHIHWDISNTKAYDAPLFETMSRALNSCRNVANCNNNNNDNNRTTPTVAIKLCKFSIPRSGPSMFLPSVNGQARVLSPLGLFMTQFATSLVLINSGLEFLLPDLLTTDLRALEELEIRVNRYCPDDTFVRWLQSLFQRQSQIKDDESQSSDFTFDDLASSTIFFDDSPSSPTATIPAQGPPSSLRFSPNTPTPSTAPISTIPPPPPNRQPLRRLALHNLQFSPQQWKDLLGSIDYSSLRLLNLERVSFGDYELQLLRTNYIDQVAKARDAAGRAREEKEREKGEELVVRFYTTKVSSLQIEKENAKLRDARLHMLKFVLV